MNQASNVLNSNNNITNINNNKNATNYAANNSSSGRLSAVIDKQRAPSSLGNNLLLGQFQQQQQQQTYENASADQISYFDNAPNYQQQQQQQQQSIYNPSLKPSESGRLSRRQKSTPSTVHFASPLVTPIPYMEQQQHQSPPASRCYIDSSAIKENLDPRSERKRHHHVNKESRSHSTIPAYR